MTSVGKFGSFIMSDSVVSPQQMESIVNAFETFDSNHDGNLEDEELEPALRALGFNPRKDEINDMLEDSSRSGIDIKCFVYFVYKHSRCVDVRQEIIDSFKVFDRDGSSTLPKAKVVEILKSIKNPIPDKDISALISASQVQGDRVNYVQLVDGILTA